MNRKDYDRRIAFLCSQIMENSGMDDRELEETLDVLRIHYQRRRPLPCDLNPDGSNARGFIDRDGNVIDVDCEPFDGEPSG